MANTNKPAWILVGALIVLLFMGAIVVDLIINPFSSDEEGSIRPASQAASNTAAAGTATAVAQATILSGTVQAVSATQTVGAEETTAATALWLASDTDLDDLTNSQELAAGTSPDNKDSDGDGLFDGVEVKQLGTDPLRPDTDEDGLSDGEEVKRWGTDPLKPDTDGDGILDKEEVERNLDPLESDTDHDGTPDLDDADSGQLPLPTNTYTPTPTGTPTITPTATPILFVEFEETNYTVNEQDDEAIITVILNEPVNQPVRVDYDTLTRGTADAGEDYITTSGQLFFSPDDTEETFAIPILDDTIDEEDEIVIVELSDPEVVALGSKNQTRLTIVDDDEVSIRFSRVERTGFAGAAQTPGFQVPEGQSRTIVVELSTSSARLISVRAMTEDNTAQAGVDYNSVLRTLEFAPGVTEMRFTVTALEDDDNVDEVITLTLSDPSPSDINIETPSANLIIADND